MKQKILTVRLNHGNEGLKDDIEKMAAKEGRSTNNFLNWILADFVRENKE